MKKSRKESIEIIKQFLKDHKSRKIKAIILTKTKSKRRIGQNGIHYIQLSLMRSNSLIEGYLTNYKKHPLLSILSVRCHFENTGAISYFYHKLLKYYDKEISYEELDDSLRRLSLGYKTILGSKKHTNKCDPISVMNMIDKTDNLLRSISPSISVFRNLYNELSEFCHPNCFGMIMFCTTKKNMKYYYSKKFEASMMFMHHLCISLKIFLVVYDKIYEVLKSEEEIPVILK